VPAREDGDPPLADGAGEVAVEVRAAALMVPAAEARVS
jgi:hypothetical protein